MDRRESLKLLLVAAAGSERLLRAPGVLARERSVTKAESGEGRLDFAFRG